MSRKDYLEKYIHKDGTLRASALIATSAVEDMRVTLNSYEIATVVLGRCMVGALLMAAHLRKGDNVAVYIRGNGPLAVAYAEGNFEGATRAYTPYPHVVLPLKDQKLDIPGAVGIGLLEVVRGSQHSDILHKGAVELKTSQVGEDIAYYLFQSQQIPSVVALSVELHKNGSVKSAGGVLIELMPGADETIITDIENNMKSMKNMGDLISSGATPLELLSQFMNPNDIVKIHGQADIKYQCRCSKDKVKRALLLLGHEELDDMLNSKEDKQLINCDFCGKRYEITPEELLKLREKSFKNSLN